MNERKARVDIFQDTLRRCKDDPDLADAIGSSLKRTHILYGEEAFRFPCSAGLHSPVITVTAKRSFQAARDLSHKYPGRSIGVLNFANENEPGGAVLSGSAAQEESLCRCSTLYPCLNTERLNNEYYGAGNKTGDFRGSGTVVFIPDVIVFKTDEELPALLPNAEWMNVNVLVCAAPDRRDERAIAYDADRKEAVYMGGRDWTDLYRKRIRSILFEAYSQGIEVLVLGTWGSGGFKNRPEQVSRAFRDCLRRYGKYFEAIEFAIDDRTGSQRESDNLAIYREVLELR